VRCRRRLGPEGDRFRARHGWRLNKRQPDPSRDSEKCRKLWQSFQERYRDKTLADIELEFRGIAEREGSAGRAPWP
jgi:hypothetical protein